MRPCSFNYREGVLELKKTSSLKCGKEGIRKVKAKSKLPNAQTRCPSHQYQTKNVYLK